MQKDITYQIFLQFVPERQTLLRCLLPAFEYQRMLLWPPDVASQSNLNRK